MQWTSILFILIYVFYTMFMMNIFRNIYQNKNDILDRKGIQMCMERDVKLQEEPTRVRGSTKYRTIKEQDLPPESRPGWKVLRDDVPVSRLPQCLIVGFSKCGTSALSTFLNIHPDIVTLDWEVDYFCDRVYPKYSTHW